MMEIHTFGRIIITSIVGFKVVIVLEAKEPTTSTFSGGANMKLPVTLGIVFNIGS